MRTYTLKNRKFNSFEEFIAAKRDYDLIEDLKLSAESEGLGGDSILEEIKKRKVRFNSEFGDEYLEEVVGPEIMGQNREETTEEKPSIDIPVPKKRTVVQVFRVIRNTSILFLVALIIGLGVLLAVNIKSEEKGKENFASLREAKAKSLSSGQETVGAILPEYISLYSQNPDMAGWISIDLTPVDYPIMYRRDDNDYYLTRNFNGEYDPNGMLILDKRCDPLGNNINTLIHGHNMKSGLMFGSLRKFLDQGYAFDHRIINFDTLYERKTFEIIAVFLSSVDKEDTDDFKYYEYININNEWDFNSYINAVKEISAYKTDVTAYYGDRLITLSTCDYAKNEGRLVIVGKQVESQ